MKKPLPKFRTEEAFLKFFDKTDFGDYFESTDLVPATVDIKPKNKTISMRLSSHLLDAVKKAAAHQGTKYQKLIRLILEQNIKAYL